MHQGDLSFGMAYKLTTFHLKHAHKLRTASLHSVSADQDSSEQLRHIETGLTFQCTRANVVARGSSG